MKVTSALEAILFLHGEPLSTARLAKLAGAKKAVVEAALRGLQNEYRERGITLIHNSGEWQFATSPGERSIVEKLATSDLRDELSKAGLEVLAIVAYKGPVGRAAIDYIRGVDSSFSLRNLLLRGLVSREENPKDRRSYLYRISTEFLKYFGLRQPHDLPHYDELRRSAPDSQEAFTPRS